MNATIYLVDELMPEKFTWLYLEHILYCFYGDFFNSCSTNKHFFYIIFIIQRPAYSCISSYTLLSYIPKS